MPVRFEKSAYDPVEPRKDGLRIVATRFWPRGLRKEAADLYLPDLAPSETLLRTFQAGEIGWRDFARRYREEMAGQKSHLRTLGWIAGRGTVTVMCACERPETCHRRILAGLIERAS